MSRVPLFLRTAAVLGAGSLAIALAGCAGNPAAAEPAEPAPAAVATDAGPVILDNCGTEVEIDSPPQRIITVKSTPLELVLALGAGDRVVGSAYSDGPVPEEFAEAAAGIPVISEKLPSQEAALALEPDFVFGGWESNFSVDGVGERASLHALGVNTYVAPAACQGAGYQPNPLTFDDVFDSFLEAGRILGEEEAAEELVTAQRAQLETLTADARGLTAVWYSSGRDEPFIGAGIGAPAMIMERAGLVNAFADVEDSWISSSWEKVADLDPDVLVLVSSPRNTAQDKIDLLTSNPATAAMRAVADRRFVIVDFAETESGVRNVDTVAHVIAQLAGL